MPLQHSLASFYFYGSVQRTCEKPGQLLDVKIVLKTHYVKVKAGGSQTGVGGGHKIPCLGIRILIGI